MAVSSRSRTPARPRRGLRILAWATPIFFVFLIVAFFVIKAGIDSYLHSDRFRTFVSQKAGGTLHADADLLPLNFTGMQVYTDGFSAKGGPDAAFSGLQLDQVRAEISVKKFLEKAWVVEQVDVARLRRSISTVRAPTAHWSTPPIRSPPPRRTPRPKTPAGCPIAWRSAASSSTTHNCSGLEAA